MKSIQVDFSLRHSPMRVWAAITDSKAIAQWLMPNDFVAELGHKFTFVREPIPQLKFDGIAHCEVTTLDPPKKLAFTFKGGPLDTVVTFRLEPEGTGTHLYFEHAGFDESDPAQSFSLQFMSKGWSELGAKIDAVTASGVADD